MIPEGFVRALDGFEAVLEATPPDRWLSPSPCEGWCAVDVAGHVIAGLLVIEMRAAGRPLPRDDPTARRMAPGAVNAGCSVRSGRRRRARTIGRGCSRCSGATRPASEAPPSPPREKGGAVGGAAGLGSRYGPTTILILT